MNVLIVAVCLGFATASHPADVDVLRAFRVLGDRQSSEEAREEAKTHIRTSAAKNPLVCLELARRIVIVATPESLDEALVAFTPPAGYCRPRITEHVVAIRQTSGDIARLVRFLELKDFERGEGDCVYLMSTGSRKDQAYLATRAAEVGATALLPAIAHEAAAWGREGDSIVWHNHEDGSRQSAMMAESMLALGAERFLDMPNVRAGLAQCATNLRAKYEIPELNDAIDPTRVEDRAALVKRIEAALEGGASNTESGGPSKRTSDSEKAKGD